MRGWTSLHGGPAALVFELLEGDHALEGRKLNGRLTLDDVVLYCERVNWKTFALVFAGAFLVLYLLITLVTLRRMMIGV